MDIDGVLNFNGCRDKIGGLYFVNDNRIKLLKEIIDATGAKIVLSSTWRIGWFDRDYGIHSRNAEDFAKLEEKLKESGITFISRTPRLANGYRGEEIKTWIDNWKGEPVESFVIIDDDADMKPFMNRLIQTSFNKGLQQKNVDRAIQLLNP
ncbi:HAD domain-containing protein [Lacrimispora indolis]|uniref:HAD domain-containing protein n=1 Tax=Lacrimispora indolis TaxID=69825 RepID=UPI000400A539|nr:HAD domain-containing protein [[Clostridium] methoxybenzovorans]